MNCTLHTVLVICTTSFRVVQFMYRPLLVFESTLGKTLCYIYTLNVCYDALHDVSVMDECFIECTVNVYAQALN